MTTVNSRKRRGRGEGSIGQRADGLWFGSLSLGYDGRGKRKRRTVYGATKRGVVAEFRKLQTDADGTEQPLAATLGQSATSLAFCRPLTTPAIGSTPPCEPPRTFRRPS